MAPPEIAANSTAANNGGGGGGGGVTMMTWEEGNAAPSYAYVTFLAGDGDYVKGVIGLAKGLRKVGAAYPLVVAVLPDVPVEHRRLLVEQGCLLRLIHPVFPPAATGDDCPFVRPYFVVNYCKLRLWEFVEYNKMIYLDADIQVFDNIDHLFDLPNGSFYGVVDCLCEMYGPPCPQKIRWPKELGPEPAFYFNGGMFMFEPNLNTYDELLRTLDVTPPTPFAEQDFLNMFFREVAKPLLPIYNMLVAMMWRHPEMVDLDKVKVVHYCVGGSKPWRYTGKEVNMDRADIKMLVKRWWDIFNDESLDFKNRGDGLGGGGGGRRRRMLAAPAAVETAEVMVLYPSVSPAA